MLALRARRPLRDARRQLDGGRLGAAGLDQPVHRAERVQPGGRNALAGQAQLGEQLARDELRQQRGDAAVGRQADLDVGDGEVGVARRDQQVAGERERHAGADRAALDRGDHRLGAVADRAHRAVQLLQPLAALLGRHVAAGGELVQVAAGAEEAAGAGEHDGADLRIVRGLAQRAGEGFVEGRAQRVAPRRIVVDEDQHLAFAARQQRLAHDACAESRPKAMKRAR